MASKPLLVVFGNCTTLPSIPRIIAKNPGVLGVAPGCDRSYSANISASVTVPPFDSTGLDCASFNLPHAGEPPTDAQPRVAMSNMSCHVLPL